MRRVIRRAQLRLWLTVAYLLAGQAALAQAAPPQLAAEARKQLTVEAIVAGGGLTGRAPESPQWSPDGRKLSFVERDEAGEHGALYYIDVASGTRAVLVSEAKLAALAPPAGTLKDERKKERISRYSIASYHWAPDSKHLLFDAHGQLWFYSLDNGTAMQLTASGDPSEDPKFSPDGAHLAYVRKHNLFVRPVRGETEKQLTREEERGAADDLLNGEVDWLYAEEFNVRSHYFWSPDGKQIAFLQMNEAAVPTYPIIDWTPHRPRVEQEKYPKAGDRNPEVRVGVIGSGGGGVKWITLGAREDREYIPRFGWVRPGMVWVQTLNRAQDKLELWFAEVGSGKSRKMLTESEAAAWVPVNDDFEILPSGTRFLWSSWRDGHTHLYLYSFDKKNPLAAEAKLERQLTRGDFEVFGVAAVDESKGLVYFTATNPEGFRGRRERQLYSVKLDCCSPMSSVSFGPGTHHASFAPDRSRWVDNFSSLEHPPVLRLCRVGSSDCRVLWQSRSVAEYHLAPPQMLEFTAADGTTTLDGILLLPEGMAPGEKVPVILNPYGGPDGSVVAANAWGGWNSAPSIYLFDQLLVQRGFAVLLVDNRGTAARGKAFATAIRGHLGEVELADQLAALDQVLQRYPQLDGTRAGFWGWSYGGYLTLEALTRSGRFRAGAAVAPVTDWRNYDTAYTERYMGLPQENRAGYRNSSPVNAAGELSGRLLEAHGTSDDNVHFQNTAQMISALVDAGKQFDLAIYPGKTHGIGGEAARRHLFHAVLDHFDRYLKP